jgi:hypothetical protein
MEPIVVPALPPEAFNKHRPISDLVRNQVKHFRHIEEKLPKDVREKLPSHAITTEDEAARYIHAMTTYLLSRPRPKKTVKKAVAIKPPAPAAPSKPLALAAAAAPAQKKSAAKKKSASKKETSGAKKSQSTGPKDKKTPTKRKK